MKTLIKPFVKQILKTLGIGITKYSTLKKLQDDSIAYRRDSDRRDLEVLLQLPKESAAMTIEYFPHSTSQLRQDLFVQCYVSPAWKTGGYFVEFGATDGIELSNTYMLEKHFGWKGILAEPARCFQKDLVNQRECHIDTRCVWKESNKMVLFNEVAKASTIDSYSNSDLHAETRLKGSQGKYEVETVSLTDLLREYNAPREIDYLSIDTEGSEFDILSSFDFSEYTFNIITCEHSYTPKREKIYELLTNHGYKRVLPELSLWDDWYVKSNESNFS